MLTDLHKNLDKADDSIKKMLLQLIVKKITITDRKKNDTIALHFDENIITLFLTNDKEPPSPDGGSSHVQTYKSLQLFVVRFSVTGVTASFDTVALRPWDVVCTTLFPKVASSSTE